MIVFIQIDYHIFIYQQLRLMRQHFVDPVFECLEISQSPFDQLKMREYPNTSLHQLKIAEWVIYCLART